MRIYNVSGRLALGTAPGQAADVETASGGRFSSDPQAVYARWDEFVAWAATADASESFAIDAKRLGAPTPAPLQIFGVGLNYRAHAEEAGLALPTKPMVFTKFASSITGPECDVVRPEGHPDWEVELVVVIGRTARNVKAADAWQYVAGVTLGQDLSERILQIQTSVPPQFSLGKSLPGFSPMGPALVSVDEFTNPDDIAISCAVNGRTVQSSRTSDMIFSTGEIIEFLSGVLTLSPGDIIFTGTPAGVGWGMDPKGILNVGDVLTSEAEGIGSMRHVFVAP